MSTVQLPAGEMLVTVKSREVQRGIMAEMASDPVSATRHLLAAAHLELVLAGDYAQSGQDDMALRSRLSAASCFWRAGQRDESRKEFGALIQDFPIQAGTIQQVLAQLENNGSE